MTQVHFRKAGSGDYIKDWPNWTGVVPAFPDLVVLHYGDDNEEEKRYRVEGREISGTEPDDVTIYLSEYPSNQCNLTDEEIEDLRQEICRESERLSAEHNPALDLTIEDCREDLSIRAYKQVNTIEKPVWKIEWQLGETIDPDREADDSVMVIADTYWQAVRMVRRNANLDESDVISITSVTLFGGVLIEVDK